MAKKTATRNSTPSNGRVADEAIHSGVTPLVFVSHDSRDADLAEAFTNLLTDASGGILKSFRSSDRKGNAGIEFGAEWYKTIMERLNTATDVVALLTPNSIDRPWILYEAGVAKGKLDSVVFGLAVGVPLEKASTGPFAQFQNSGDDEDSLTKLVLQLIRRNPEAAPREEAVRRQVQAFRANVGSLAKERKPAATVPRVDETAVAKLFEEVKVMFRDLPEQVELKLKGTIGRRSKQRSLHPGMIEELIFHPRFMIDPDGHPLGWLLLASVLREELPWLSQIAFDIYSAYRSGKSKEAQAAKRTFADMLKVLRESPSYLKEVLFSNPENYRMVHHLPEMMEQYDQQILQVRVTGPTKRRTAELPSNLDKN